MTHTDMKVILKKIGMTQKQLAKEIGCAPQSVLNWRGEIPTYATDIVVMMEQRFMAGFRAKTAD